MITGLAFFCLFSLYTIQRGREMLIHIIISPSIRKKIENRKPINNNKVRVTRTRDTKSTKTLKVTLTEEFFVEPPFKCNTIW